jgi:hypothetical protein
VHGALYGNRIDHWAASFCKGYEYSGDFVKVVKQTRIHDIISAFDIKVFKSMRSLKWNVGYGGNGFTITSETIPTIFQDIILANIINLLLVS